MKYNDFYYFDVKYFKYIIIILLFSYIKIILNENSTENEKISVIVPTYNRGHSILKSIYSILNQTYKFLEILVIDDGSTDDTRKVIKQIDDKKIRYIRMNKNRGGSFARNIGIKKASGKYISFQDSDDIYHPNKLEKQYKNLIQNNTDLDFCKVCLFINESKMFFFPNKRQEKNIKKGKVEDELCNGNFISTQSILVKSLFIKKFLFDTHFPRLQDYDLVLRMIPNLKVSYTDEVLVDLYRRNDSIGNSNQKLKESLNLLLNKKYDIKCNINNIYNKYIKLNKLNMKKNES